MKTLYRPINQAELDLIEKMDYLGFPPRLKEQPYFYPVMNLQYAIDITVQWNVPAYGKGYITEFDVNEDYLKKFNIENVGGEIHNELWVPSEELEEFNSNIQGKIRVVAEY